MVAGPTVTGTGLRYSIHPVNGKLNRVPLGVLPACKGAVIRIGQLGRAPSRRPGQPDYGLGDPVA